MTLSTLALARLRRMIDDNEAVPDYDDETIQDYADDRALPDSAGIEPGEDDWIPTYDLNAIAADLWEVKASGKWDKFDVAVYNGSFSRRQKFDNAMAQARYFRSRARAYNAPLRNLE